jgi:hypothetical protein
LIKRVALAATAKQPRLREGGVKHASPALWRCLSGSKGTF